MAHVLLPSETKQNNVWGELHLVSDIVIKPKYDQAVIYGADGWVIHVEDPDTAQNVDVLYRTMVPFDQDVAQGAFDLDTSAPESGPAFEPGEPSLEAIIDASNVDDNKHWFKRRKMLSYASHPRGFNNSDLSWVPSDVFQVRSRRNIPVDLMSVSAFAVTVPSMNDTTATAPATPGDEKTWIQIKYMEVILEQAWMYLVGLVETDAETPYEDAALLIEDFLEPTVFENTAGQFFSTAVFETFTSMTWDITVPGRREIKMLSAEG